MILVCTVSLCVMNARNPQCVPASCSYEILLIAQLIWPLATVCGRAWMWMRATGWCADSVLCWEGSRTLNLAHLDSFQSETLAKAKRCEGAWWGGSSQLLFTVINSKCTFWVRLGLFIRLYFLRSLWIWCKICALQLICVMNWNDELILCHCHTEISW